MEVKFVEKEPSGNFVKHSPVCQWSERPKGGTSTLSKWLSSYYAIRMCPDYKDLDPALIAAPIRLLASAAINFARERVSGLNG